MKVERFGTCTMFGSLTEKENYKKITNLFFPKKSKILVIIFFCLIDKINIGTKIWLKQFCVCLYRKIWEKACYVYMIPIIALREYTMVVRLDEKIGKMVIAQYFPLSFKLSSHMWAENMKKNICLVFSSNFL